MFSSRHRLAILLLFLLMAADSAGAADTDTMIWLADGVSLEGTQRITLLPVIDDTKKEHDDDIVQLVTQTLHNALTDHGVAVMESDVASPTIQLSLEVHIVTYIPGSIGSQWADIDGGTAACILRSYLFRANNEEAIAEIIVGKQLLAGGLFSEHPGLTAVKQAARQTALTLANLFATKQ